MNYREERAAQRKAEMQAGRRRTTITMMEGLIEELCADYGINKGLVSLDTKDEDLRKWEVVVVLADGVAHRENLWVFPSDEIKTILMLLPSNHKR